MGNWIVDWDLVKVLVVFEEWWEIDFGMVDNQVVDLKAVGNLVALVSHHPVQTVVLGFQVEGRVVFVENQVVGNLVALES